MLVIVCGEGDPLSHANSRRVSSIFIPASRSHSVLLLYSSKRRNTLISVGYTSTTKTAISDVGALPTRQARNVHSLPELVDPTALLAHETRPSPWVASLLRPRLRISELPTSSLAWKSECPGTLAAAMLLPPWRDAGALMTSPGLLSGISASSCGFFGELKQSL